MLLSFVAMTRAILILFVFCLYVLHQDIWYWNVARPLIFGFLPIGLFYHAAYSVAVSVLMLLLIKYAWPSHIEHEAELKESVPEQFVKERYKT
tara:strand:+ start:49 stop:327 length:279 start_codon:yes stop_codon:yes gene_type:complete